MADRDPHYSALTRGIQVSVEPIYLEDQSNPDEQHFVWAYRVEIENTGSEVVQLRSRHWLITDAQGRVQEVRGRGVVGEEPILRPGDKFQYTSGAPLPTASGFMGGSYQMETTDGQFFDVEIPTFSLDSPDGAALVH